MKLYTEEVLRNSMNSVKYYMEHYNASVIDKIIENHIKALAPIELPSDEEIEEASHDQATFAPSFIAGAQWYREQLKK